MSEEASTGLMIGYARVSTDDQKLDLQRDAMAKAGVDPARLYSDQMSAVKAKRPGLEAALKALRPGDTLVVWRLDRLGRTMVDLCALTNQIRESGAHLKSLTEAFDTGSAVGTLMFHMLAAFAEFERGVLRERTNAGLAAANARGRRGGRKPTIDPIKRRALLSLLADNGPDAMSMQEIATQVGVTKQTVYRYFPRGRENAEVVAEREKRWAA